MLLKKTSLGKITRDHDLKNELLTEEFFFNRIHIFRRDTRNLSPKRLCVNINSYYTLWICIQGTGTLLVDNIAFDLQEGEGLVIYPGQQHLRMPDTQIHGEWLLIRFSGGVIPSWLETNRMHKLEISGISVSHLEDLCASHADYQLEKSDIHKNACSCHLALLLNSTRKISTYDNKAIIDSTKRTDYYVKQACQMLLNPECTKMSIEQIAEQIGITDTYLRACIKKQTDASPGDIRRSQRLSLARHLLQHSGCSIGIISEKCGFDSIYSFSRFFKKQTGIAPSKFRKQFRNSE